MHTLNANITILSAKILDDKISGTAIDTDSNINVNYSTVNNDTNLMIFIPAANLVVAGKFRIGKEIATIGVWIHTIIAVIPHIKATSTTPIASIEAVESPTSATPVEALESYQPLEINASVPISNPVISLEPSTPAKSPKKTGSRSSSKTTAAKKTVKAIAS
jgi:hypothetical protein